MTVEEGLNLAGVETVLTLERELERARREMARMRERAAELEERMANELERARERLRTEIVPYGAYDITRRTPGDGGSQRVSIPIERKRKRR
jgi:hypothetical protein